ncbi:MAG: hypothetical protein ACRD4D_07855, partial [Candidatus Acidiferrales bacterium]
VVPVRIEGVFELKRAGKRWARPGKVKVTIGEPVRFAPEADAAEIARALEETVKSLKQENEKADPSPASAGSG